MAKPKRNKRERAETQTANSQPAAKRRTNTARDSSLGPLLDLTPVDPQLLPDGNAAEREGPDVEALIDTSSDSDINVSNPSSNIYSSGKVVDASGLAANAGDILEAAITSLPKVTHVPRPATSTRQRKHATQPPADLPISQPARNASSRNSGPYIYSDASDAYVELWGLEPRRTKALVPSRHQEFHQIVARRMVAKLLTDDGVLSDGFRVTPWLDSARPRYSIAMLEQWRSTKQTLEKKTRQKIDDIPDEVSARKILDSAGEFRCYVARKAKDEVPDAYGIYDSAFNKERLLYNFAFLAEDPSEPTKKRFLNEGLARVIARTLFVGGKWGLGTAVLTMDILAQPSANLIGFFGAVISHFLSNIQEGGSAGNVRMEGHALEATYNAIRVKWSQLSGQRQRAIWAILKARMKRYTAPVEQPPPQITIEEDEHDDDIADLLDDIPEDQKLSILSQNVTPPQRAPQLHAPLQAPLSAQSPTLLSSQRSTSIVSDTESHGPRLIIRLPNNAPFMLVHLDTSMTLNTLLVLAVGTVASGNRLWYFCNTWITLSHSEGSWKKFQTWAKQNDAQGKPCKILALKQSEWSDEAFDWDAELEMMEGIQWAT